MLRLKRVYDAPTPEDGQRILVDRLWPRGVDKKTARIDYWAKNLAPSNELRRWYRHDPNLWQEFRRRYRKELLSYGSAIDEMLDQLADTNATLLFASRAVDINNAVVLKEFIENTPPYSERLINIFLD